MTVLASRGVAFLLVTYFESRLACDRLNKVRGPAPLRKRFAVTIHWLATSPTFHKLAKQWDIGKNTANLIARQVLKALKRTKVARSVQFPHGEALQQVMTHFEALANLPHCAGAIDGCFLPLQRPASRFGSKYWCYKQIYAVILVGSSGR